MDLITHIPILRAHVRTARTYAVAFTRTRTRLFFSFVPREVEATRGVERSASPAEPCRLLGAVPATATTATPSPLCSLLPQRVVNSAVGRALSTEQ
jgi:hypothetical protein